MFHQGTLQDGIGKAVQESKCVVCFVTDNGEEGNKWENEWLQDQNIPNALERHAIALRLQAGSEEAGFLSAFCPVSETPNLAVIHQGQLRDQLKSGITKNDFTFRLLQAIRPQQTRPTQTQATSPGTTSTATATASNNTAASTLTSSQSTQPTPSNNNSAPPITQQSPQPIQSNSDSTPSTSPSPQPTQPQDSRSNPRNREDVNKAREDQAKRKREAKEERARILKDIENDKIERRRREEERKKAAQLQADQGSDFSDASGASAMQNATQPEQRSSSKQHSSANVQVRLPDGNTIRGAFPSTAPVSDVRKWINEQTGESNAYSLRLVLTPAPSRVISASGDKSASTLTELDLAPSATLVMVPSKSKKSYATAVPGGQEGVQGVVSSIWAYVMLFINAIMNFIFSIVDKVKFFLGVGDAAARPAPPQGDAADAAPSSSRATGSNVAGKAASQGNAGSIRIRTLRDQRDEEGEDTNRFYNGNRLSFEPNVKDEDDEDVRPE